ncbi:MAG: TIGR04282 family arsenosugar biosynthesis glycosyltransferase [Planctomycetota bacterium]
MTERLGVMAKYWQVGQVKTRLGATIGLEQSARLHRIFCLQLARSLSEVAHRRSFVVTPSDAMPSFENELPSEWALEPQADGDLGSRMKHWFANRENASSSILIGADCPRLTRQDLEEAFACLADHDIVLGPAHDGGYYLVGLRSPAGSVLNALFDGMVWSQSSVFETTLQRAAACGLSVATLTPNSDVDTEADLSQLFSDLQASDRDTDRSLEREIQAVMAMRDDA